MQRRNAWRPLDGVLLLDKPCGITSNAALQKARRMLNAAKGGHTGTLDPMASGLLPLAFGEATKFSQMLLDADKVYVAKVTLGVETDTGDADGAPIASCAVEVTREQVERVLNGFVGEIDQIPPMFSALKSNGRPLYEYARAGIEVEREARRVSIHALSLLEMGQDWFCLQVHCSKGTYVRTLAVDVGRELGCGAHLSALRRTDVASFSVAQAVPLAELEHTEADQRSAKLLSVDALVAHLVRVDLDQEQADAILQGRALELAHGLSGLVRIFDPSGGFLGVAEGHPGGKLSPKRLIAARVSK